MTAPAPGDFAVVSTGTRMGPVIQWAQSLMDHGDTRWDHAVIASRRDEHGTLLIVEAMPSGAQEVPWHYDDRPHKWSTGIIRTTPEAGTAARRYIGGGYSFLDYLAIAAHAWHVPFPGLKHIISGSRHMICSQLCDQAELDGGVHLFSDGRWPGYVTPLDLGRLLGA